MRALEQVLDWRHAGANELALELISARDDTWRCFAAYQEQLGESLRVPLRAELNPPFWELAHVGWFAERWLLRHPERQLGRRANPTAALDASALAHADALLDSSAVPHASRWSLHLPRLALVQEWMDQCLERSLAHLAQTDGSDAQLYFFRLALAHEDMHGEAWRYMAHGLGFEAAPLWPRPQPMPRAAMHQQIATKTLDLGRPDAGFTFDNERGEMTAKVNAFEIDTHCVSHDTFNGYLEQLGRAPRALGADQLGSDPARYVNLADAQGFCIALGRRLPTEAQWRAAADSIAWGEVWEWTATPFAPFGGFTSDPYLDYSQPWFEGHHTVLKGASRHTHPRMKSAHYRNFFLGERADVMTGFRTVSAP